MNPFAVVGILSDDGIEMGVIGSYHTASTGMGGGAGGIGQVPSGDPVPPGGTS